MGFFEFLETLVSMIPSLFDPEGSALLLVRFHDIVRQDQLLDWVQKSM